MSELENKYQKAIEALKFYADEENYEMRPEYDESGKMKNACILLNDLESFLDYYTCGKNKARETLKEVGEI